MAYSRQAYSCTSLSTHLGARTGPRGFCQHCMAIKQQQVRYPQLVSQHMASLSDHLSGSSIQTDHEVQATIHAHRISAIVIAPACSAAMASQQQSSCVTRCGVTKAKRSSPSQAPGRLVAVSQHNGTRYCIGHRRMLRSLTMHALPHVRG